MGKNKCHGCIFADDFRDMSATIPVCNRCKDLEKAVAAREAAGSCRWRITLEDVIAMQERTIAPPQQNNTEWEWSGDMYDA